MKNLLSALSMGVIAISFAAPAFATEIKTVVGYVETKTVVNERDSKFHEIDESKDGAINFKEFQKAAMLVNEYEMFNMNDTNNDNLLSLDEYRNFSKEGPAHFYDTESATNFNFNKKRQ